MILKQYSYSIPADTAIDSDGFARRARLHRSYATSAEITYQPRA